MNKTILAIDGGATKTAMTVCDEQGFEFYSATSTGSNYQVIGEKNVEEIITNLLTDAANNLHDWKIDAAIFAIAGIDTVTDLNIVQNIVNRSIAASPLKIESYVVENDVEATLKGLTKELPSALLISGTGAIAYGYAHGKLVRAGGWGHRVGDEGSGYWIGQQIGRSIFKEVDGRGPKTALTELILKQLKLENVDELYSYLYNTTYTNARLASLGSTLQQAVNMDDVVAKAIAHDAATELIQLAQIIIKKLNAQNAPMLFYLNGGVLKNNACIYDQFYSQMQGLYPKIEFHLCDQQPLFYLVQRALQLAPGK